MMEQRNTEDQIHSFEYLYLTSLCPTITNMTISISFGRPFNLTTLHQYLEGSIYNPNRHNSLTYRLTDPKCTFLIFSTGRAVLVGVKLMTDVERALSYLTEFFRTLNSPIFLSRPLVKNIVASINVRMMINLEKFAKGEPYNAEFTPELFPALIYRIGQSNPCITVHRTGIIIVTGCLTYQDILTTYYSFCRTLYKYVSAK